MAEVLIIIPTHSNVETFENAVQSVLEQSFDDIEVQIIGDGALPAIVEQAQTFQQRDSRVSFHNYPKTIRRAEEHRHQAIVNSPAQFISYLADDDLFLPHHVEYMRRQIGEFDFINPRPTFIDRNDVVWCTPTDIALESNRLWHLREDVQQNSISLSGVMHTKMAYENLSEGWAPTPEGLWTDLHMWQKFFRNSHLSFKTSHRSTILKFLDFNNSFDQVKIDQNRKWFDRQREVSFVAYWDEIVEVTHQRAAAEQFALLSQPR